MAHIHEKIDFTAEAFVVFDNKVLLRLHDKYKMWLAVGGHIEFDEDPTEAVVREVKEEVGLDIILWNGNQVVFGEAQGNVQLIPPVAMNRHSINAHHEHVSLIYFARATSDKVTVEHAPDRSDDWRWLSVDQLDSLELRNDTRALARLALMRLKS